MANRLTVPSFPPIYVSYDGRSSIAMGQLLAPVRNHGGAGQGKSAASNQPWSPQHGTTDVDVRRSHSMLWSRVPTALSTPRPEIHDSSEGECEPGGECSYAP